MLNLWKIVYLWRCFSLAWKLLMRRFRGALNYILNVNFKYMLQKIFSDKIVSNFDSQEVGPKWHFLSTILQIFTEKMFFKFSLNFAEKILKSSVFLKSSLLVVYCRPLEWLWDILLGREICSQSWAIIFQKSTKF